MKKNNTNVGMKLLEGGLIGAVLGVAAGMLMAPKSGKKMRADIKHLSGDFFNYMAPKIKKLKHLTEKEYNDLVTAGVTNFGKLKKLSVLQQKELIAEAKKSWKHLNKHFK
jgi:gas vesicle protein